MTYEELAKLNLDPVQNVRLTYPSTGYSFVMRYKNCILWYKGFSGNKDIDFTVEGVL